MNVDWTDPAKAQLDGIRAFLSQVSEAYSDDVLERITRRTWQLKEFPMSGAVYERGRPLEIRYLLESSYRILYIVARDHVDIIGVVHTSRRLL